MKKAVTALGIASAVYFRTDSHRFYLYPKGICADAGHAELQAFRDEDAYRGKSVC